MNETLRMVLGSVIGLIMLYLAVKAIFKTLKWFINLFRSSKTVKVDLSNLNAQDLIAHKEERIPNQKSILAKVINNLIMILLLPFYLLKKIIGGICYLLQDHCAKCDSSDIECISTQEIYRWQGSKKVTENLASGKTKQKYVNLTYVTRRRIY
ncbi:hypothetical protein BBH51_03590 [Aggregatibacter actinomycetemcomitans]|uniref:Uncharacterized protein n=1 Tax=Aggregatibacter actinomycetemcomitans TaxID=714 RepID=A0A5D0EI71_AGGAC|nr:hypothetical protein [Aggregatibacter actinomycetemcomitans]AFI87501.1 hypothetical protein D7S_01768 [Aggregatibacter actinomycetemcomitans D7S-1]AMQ94387.1 hypothetical protein ACT75_07545 [Aggregatibacter actinomycetemcomitans]ANU81806.1 hypothetical protein BBH51_03590 [Aggregatibacter actinomycetemcomitans]EKX97057.1 hypothetical protein HMPREF9996_01030 [Aggregatibacter actinomycetemcomitans Y4]KND85991.1 hypothetical protein H5P1_0200535 [Aggregatibacter actinomycetemcomitans serotyp